MVLKLTKVGSQIFAQSFARFEFCSSFWVYEERNNALKSSVLKEEKKNFDTSMKVVSMGSYGPKLISDTLFFVL